MFRTGIGIFAKVAATNAVNYQKKKNNNTSIIMYPQQKVMSPQYKFALNPHEKYIIKQFQAKEIFPVIVALYDKRDGTVYADLAIEYFQNKGLKVVMVSSDEAFNHAIFFQQNIDGIYLPGGPNIPIANSKDHRKVFEDQLSNFAINKDIPLLGICRGQQAIGHYHGYDVKDLKDFDHHYAHGHGKQEEIYNETKNPSLNNTVVVIRGSQFYQALQHKLNKESQGEFIEYHTICLHEQCVLNDSDNTNLTVAARNKYDNSAENVERSTGKYYTIGIQHHPEAVIESFTAMRQEKISSINSEFSEAIKDMPYTDAGIHICSEFSQALRNIRVANGKSRDEKAARAELGLFTNQVKKHFLDQPREDRKNKPRC